MLYCLIWVLARKKQNVNLKNLKLSMELNVDGRYFCGKKQFMFLKLDSQTVETAHFKQKFKSNNNTLITISIRL